VADEVHVLTEVNASSYRILIPVLAPFYLDNFILKHIDSTGVESTLMPDVDYYFCLPYIGASRSIGKMVYGAVSINTQLIDGHLKMSYQTLGGDWTADAAFVRERLAELIYNPRITIWDVVTNKPNQFPPTDHLQNFDTVYGQRELVDSVNALAAQITGTPNTNVPVIRHLTDTANPHQVTKAQVGLDSVMNLPVATDQEVQDKELVDKYVTLKQLVAYPITDPGVVAGLTQTTSTQAGVVQNHINDTSNPHSTTKAQIGLGSVDNTSDADKPLSTAQVGALNAVVATAAADALSKANDAAQTAIAASAPASHVGSAGQAHAEASVNAAGFMSAADKIKLDAISGTGTIGKPPILTAAAYYFIR
jgi:hypothetical protein